MRRLLFLLALLAGCTELGEKSPFPHSDATRRDAGPTGDAPAIDAATTDAEETDAD